MHLADIQNETNASKSAVKVLLPVVRVTVDKPAATTFTAVTCPRPTYSQQWRRQLDEKADLRRQTDITEMKLTTYLAAAFLCLSAVEESPAQTIQNDKNMEELNLTQEWDKTFPPERRSTSQQSNFPQPLRHHPCRRPVYPEERGGRTPGDCHKRPVRRRQGAGIRAICAGTRQTRLPYDSLRPFIHRRERRTAPLCGIARHQHRGLLRGGGLPLDPR